MAAVSNVAGEEEVPSRSSQDPKLEGDIIVIAVLVEYQML
jgi:hypothetical protein